jgi:hypothetical protein
MKFCKFLTFIAFLFLTGCGTLQIGIERNLPSTATVNNPTVQAPTLTVPVVLPSPTIETLPPTLTLPAPTEIMAAPTEISSAPTATLGPQMVKIYLIAVGDNGQSGQLIGCGDSAIPVDVEIQPTKEVLRASLEKLLSMKEQFYGQSGLYNVLYQSDLQLESITLDNGKAVINLTGTLTLGGVCDNPRVEAQLISTVLQFSTIQEASIFINGTPLKDVLSLKG